MPLTAPSSTSGREDVSWRQLAEGENKLLAMDPKLDPELLAVDPKLDPELLARSGVAEGGGAPAHDQIDPHRRARPWPPVDCGAMLAGAGADG
jgi:hypothetical protein